MNEPIAATGTWHAVMAAARRRCQCTGQCGRPHTSGQGRCLAEHRGRVRLHAAPTDPALPPEQAVHLSPNHLRAWCGDCHDGARRTARRQPDPDQPALFQTEEKPA